MSNTLKLLATAYGTTAVVLVGLDILWLSVMGGSFYKRILGDIALPTFKLAPAAIFYALYVLGIVVLAIAPAHETGRWQTAFARGLVFGLCAYATYNLSNQATLRNWPATLSGVDIVWGTTLTTVSTVCGFLLSRMLFGKTS